MGMREAWAHRRPGIIWQMGFAAASGREMRECVSYAGDEMLLLCEAPFDRRWSVERYVALMRLRDSIVGILPRRPENLLVQAGSINEDNPSDAYHLFGVLGLAGVILDNGAQRSFGFLSAAHRSLDPYGTGLITEAHFVGGLIPRHSVASKCSLQYYIDRLGYDGFATPTTRRLMVDCRPKQGIGEEEAWRRAIELATLGAWVILAQWQMRDPRVDEIRSAYRQNMLERGRVGLGDGAGDFDRESMESDTRGGPGGATGQAAATS